MRDKLYYQINALTEVYSSVPSQQLSFSRLIKGLPAFVHNAVSEQKKNKKIVVNYNLSEDINLIDKLIFIYQLINLSYDGFELFIELDGNLTSWSKQDYSTDLMHLIFLRINNNGNDEKFYAKQLDCTGDEIYLLNKLNIKKFIQSAVDDWLNYNYVKNGVLFCNYCPLDLQQFKKIMLDNRENIRKLSLSNCSFFIGEYNLENQNLFNDALFNLEELEIDFMNLLGVEISSKYFAYEVIMEVIQNSPNLKKFKLNYSKILTSSQASNLIKEALKKTYINTIQYSGDPIELHYLPEFNLKCIEIFDVNNCMIDEEILSKLITNTKLKCLSIYLREFSENYFELPQSIEELSWKNCKISIQILARMFLNLSSLKKLNLSNYTTKNIDFHIDLPDLEDLELTYSNISYGAITRILITTLKLKKLRLVSCNNLEDNSYLHINLSELQELDLSSSNIKFQGLKHLLIGAPKLKNINLFDSKIVKKNFDYKFTLSDLEDANLSFTQINCKELYLLIANSYKLKKLDLTCCKKITDKVENSFNFQYLEVLNLSDSSANFLFLEYILKNSFKLKKLDLLSCKNFEETIIADINLPVLEELNLASSNITFPGLKILLHNNFILKKLNLSHCTNIKYTKIDINIPDLTNLSLDYSSINLQGLGMLISNPNKLKIINLSYCDNLMCSADVDINLSELEVLNLMFSNISSEGLNNLLKNAPKLKVLNLSNCMNLIDNIDVKYNLPELQNLLLHSSNITLQGLNNLLKNAHELKVLNLSDCMNLIDNIDVKFNLPELQTLLLHSSNITLQGLNNLLKNAPKLKKMSLRACKNISEQFDIHVNLPDLEELNLDFSHISVQILLKFLVKSSRLKKIALRSCNSIPPKFRKLFNGIDEIHELIKELNLCQEFKSETPKITKKNQLTVGIDSDTSQNNTTLKVRKEFLQKNVMGFSDVHPSIIRHDCYDVLSFQNKQIPFVLSSSIKDSSHIKSYIADESHSSFLHPGSIIETGVYIGRFSFQLTHDWTPIPSVVAHERLQSYFKTTNAKVEIGYSEFTNLYFIRLSSLEKEEYVRTFLEVLLYPPKLKEILPKKVKKLIEDFNKYSARHLIKIPNIQGEDFIKAIIEQKVGACRHRAVAFLYKMREIAPDIKVRVIINDSHAFVEVFYAGNWLKIDLGGYEYKLEYDKDIFVEKFLPKFQDEKNNSLEKSDLSVSYDSNLDESKEVNNYFADSEEIIDLLTLLNSNDNKVLIETEDVLAARLELQTLCRKTGRSFYFIDNPEELRCVGPYIERQEDMSGKIIASPGGALYDYLTKVEKAILIINLSRFRISDFVQHNSIFDEKPLLEGLDIIQDCKIVGLTDIGVALDSSITSRFNLIQELKLTNFPPQFKISLGNNGEIIECCGGLNWSSRLIGTWVLCGQKITYKKGLIWEALLRGVTCFTFNNAPLNDPNFIRFLHDMEFYQGLYHQGEMLIASSGVLEISFTNNFSLEDQEEYLEFNDDIEQAHLLNTESLDDFLGRYVYLENEQSIELQKGLVEEASNKKLQVYLTSDLSLEEWRLLILSCKKYNTHLRVSLAPDVILPKEIKFDKDTPRVQLEENTHTQSINVQPKDLGDALFINISELSPDNLLPSLRRIETGNLQEFKFLEQEGFLTRELALDKTIVLSGDWISAKTLTQALHKYLFTRIISKKSTGKLILVQSSGQAFSFMTHTIIANLEVKPQIFSKKVSFLERENAVRDMLKIHKIIIITGPTGVGKTHFINQYYPKAFFGVDEIHNWIISVDFPAILFIDEANMTCQQWSMFEGLFQNPPGIFYAGHYWQLTESHRIIFAANPLSYGGERHLPSLFSNHPIELEFMPLSGAEFLGVLKIPENISREILPMFDFILGLSPQNLLLTPREILMVMQVTKAIEPIFANLPVALIAKNVAYAIFKSHVPKEYLVRFTTFKPEKELHFNLEKMVSIVVNTTNQPAVDALCQHLAVRKSRLGGLGGVILEGEPGVGKSQLVMCLLSEEYAMREGIDFIRLPVSLGYEKKQTMLLEAFHRGQIVIIDEINSSPMMERLLNALLEGHDLNNNKPQNPGFMIIGTQNPPAYLGRTQMTLPLKHRLQTVELQEYSINEMREILLKHGLPEEKSNVLLNSYQKHQKAQNLCFRHLLKAVKSWQFGRLTIDAESKKLKNPYKSSKDTTFFAKNIQSNLKCESILPEQINNMKKI